MFRFIFSALFFSLFTSFLQGTVFLRPLEDGEVRSTQDGQTWETAYSTPAEAITAAAGTPIYAASGTYIISSSYTFPSSTTLYGGFPGLSNDETLEDRNPELHQTIFTGDKELNDTWSHVTPTLNAYSCVVSDTSDKLHQDGRITNAPDTTDNYELWFVKPIGNNTANGFICSGAYNILFDGIIFTSFANTGSYGATFQIDNTSATFSLNNCSFIGGNANSRGHVFVLKSKSTSITNTKFLHIKTSEIGGLRLHTGVHLVDNCLFSHFYRENAGTGGACIYANATHSIEHTTFSRCINKTNKAGSDYGGMGSICGGDGIDMSFLNCTFANNFTASTGQYGSPLLARVKLLKNCIVENNRTEVKPSSSSVAYQVVGRSSALGGYAVIDGTIFRNNTITAPATTLSGGSVYLGIVGANISQQNNGQPFTLINCVFDSNEVSAPFTSSAPVSKQLCRGPFVFGIATGSKNAISVLNCTFTGPKSDNVFDVAQYGAEYAYDTHIVNSIFSVTEDDIAINWLYADAPHKIKVADCSIKNLQTLPAAITGTGIITDAIPLDNAYIPQANVPGLRSSAIVFTNDVSKQYFAYSPSSAPSTFIPAMPSLSTSASTTGFSIGDIAGITRPAGAFTKGAVQILPEVAENGVTLTIRKTNVFSSSIASGVYSYSVPAGSSIGPIEMTTKDGFVLDKWELPTNPPMTYSTDNPLTIASLTEDMILIANVVAPKVAITFDLGPYGIFNDTQTSVKTILLDQSTTFPALPPYTLNANLLEEDWGFPELVPSADATYTLRCVSTDLRTIYVTPTGAGNKDGTSWENAYDDIIAAIRDAGRYRGEVWMKTGCYRITDSILLQKNVAIRGGFSGSETSSAQADPDAYPVIISGDVNQDDYWRINGDAASLENQIPIFNELTLNEPNPDGTDSYWDATGNISDNIQIGLTLSTIGSTNILVEGITVASFSKHLVAINSDLSKGITFRKCRFIGGNSSKGGDASGSSDYENGAVYINNSSIDFDNCDFTGNHWAYNFSSVNTITNTFENCLFSGNFGGAKGATIRTRNNAFIKMNKCQFFRNCNGDEKHESATCIVLGGRPSIFTNCHFEDNRNMKFSAYGSHGMILLYNAMKAKEANIFDGCTFVKNKSSLTGSYTSHATIFCAYHDQQNTIVKNCYFASNILENASSDIPYGIIYASATAGKISFMNCTIEDNALNSNSAASALFNGSNGSIAIINSVISGTKVTPSEGTASDLRCVSPAKVSVINSAFTSNDPSYRAILGSATPLLLTSLIKGVNTDEAPALRQTLTQKGDLVARAIRGSNQITGTPIALNNNCFFFHTPTETTPWASAINPAEKTDIATPAIVPDAIGSSRTMRRYPIGPLNTKTATIIQLQ